LSRKRVLVITMDPVTDQMPGPAIRAWNLALLLSEEHDVQLVSTVAASREDPKIRVGTVGSDELARLADWADVVVSQGSLLRRFPFFGPLDKPIAIDSYDPYHLENLEPDPDPAVDETEHEATVAHLVGVVNDDLRRGDFFMCASERQRDFWLGSLAALGRVNPRTYLGDPRLERLIAVVPFGLPSAPPVATGPGLRATIPGISPDDSVVVWGGGVYNWFDPLSLVRGIDLLRHRSPPVRLVFVGMAHPNPNIPAMGVARQLRELAAGLGLEGTHVFFQEGWVPYDRRADHLLDADVGVSTHFDHVETRFSFRTRVLDYLWAGLPMVLTEGDPLADLVASSGAGRVVPAGDPQAIAEGLDGLLSRPPDRTLVAELASRFRWEIVADPLLEWCRSPRRSADAELVDRAATPETTGSTVVIERWRKARRAVRTRWEARR
jgi:glycosyltransferase involved in cell wall biosynthesis